ncbi:hypothetical protein RRG08_059436 [Elysia crispata]|uniref:Uncharacterized protein n=1 Tax=Elysia crispata TaxID=231223 RepID=A0AAE1A5T6_9GAST|nr:hypothetical protein RRG08_059436 [Elysia crispata]
MEGSWTFPPPRVPTILRARASGIVLDSTGQMGWTRRQDARQPTAKTDAVQRVGPRQTNASTSAAGRHIPETPKVAQQARDWCSCIRDWTHHRGSEKASLTPVPSHFRFTYHYPLVQYLRTTLQDRVGLVSHRSSM